MTRTNGMAIGRKASADAGFRSLAFTEVFILNTPTGYPAEFT